MKMTKSHGETPGMKKSPDMKTRQEASVLSANILLRIANLRNMSKQELKDKWRELFGKEPPAYNRPFLIKRLIYRVQEIAYGGLKPETRLKMDELLDAAGFNEQAMRGRSGKGRGTAARDSRTRFQLVPGTLLIREWQGTRYEVTALPDGFSYAGRRYRSLTAVAMAITGTHWNGWKFFGCAPRKPQGKA